MLDTSCATDSVKENNNKNLWNKNIHFYYIRIVFYLFRSSRVSNQILWRKIMTEIKQKNKFGLSII